MAKQDTTAAPTFESVALDTLPAAVRQSSDTNIATGKALLAIIGNGEAAVDPTTYADRKAATNRAAVLKRAVGAAVKAGASPVEIGTRVYAVDGKWRVAITPATAANASEATDAPASE